MYGGQDIWAKASKRLKKKSTAEHPRGSMGRFFGQGATESLSQYQQRGVRETGDPDFGSYMTPRAQSTIFKKKRKTK